MLSQRKESKHQAQEPLTARPKEEFLQLELSLHGHSLLQGVVGKQPSCMSEKMGWDW